MCNAELLLRRNSAVPCGVASATSIFVKKAENAEIWVVEGKCYLDLRIRGGHYT